MYARETLVGFPLHVKSPARRRPLLRSKSAAAKRKTPVGVSFFLQLSAGIVVHAVNGMLLRPTDIFPEGHRRFPASERHTPAALGAWSQILPPQCAFVPAARIHPSGNPTWHPSFPRNSPETQMSCGCAGVTHPSPCSHPGAGQRGQL